MNVRGVTKRFGDRVALRDVSFEAADGELVAVIGPNGAGKTTLLSIVGGLLRADAGEVSRPPREVGWVPQQGAVYSKLSVAENLRLFARLEKVADPPVLLLDEPSSALDPRQRERLWEFILELARGGTTVVFSTHDVGEAERYADRVLVLADGELLFAGTPGELESAVGDGGAREFETAFVRFLHAKGH